MNRIKITLAILSMLFLTNCSTVVSLHPVGLEIYPTNPSEWDGTWLGDDITIKIKVVDESQGIVKLSWIEGNEKDLHLESMVFKVMKGKKWLYANLLETDGNADEDKYYWGKITKDKREIIFWFPSVENFIKAAESKKIEAIIHRKAVLTNGKKTQEVTKPDSVTLVDKPEKIVKLVENGGSEYFEWENPVVLIKIFKVHHRNAYLSA